MEHSAPQRVVIPDPQQGDGTMDKDRVEGSLEQAKGKVKEVAGKVTGDAKLEGEGKADQVAGKVQNAVGGLKDAVRGN
jgi:uncharacterized protein YjbJ (UPF0337 family)